MMKLKQRRYCHTRRADRLHTGAGDGVQHPRGDRRDHAGWRLDVYYLAGDTLFAVGPLHPAPIERVPPVMNFNTVPDMGRMTGRLP
jgi:hypothetical protein